MNGWKLLEKCIALLKPFEGVTIPCSSVSEVIPHIKVLLSYLIDENVEIIQLQTELENGLKRRFKLEDNTIFTLTTAKVQTTNFRSRKCA